MHKSTLTLRNINDAINHQTDQYVLPLDQCNSFYFGTEHYHQTCNGKHVALYRNDQLVLTSKGREGKQFSDPLVEKILTYVHATRNQ